MQTQNMTIQSGLSKLQVMHLVATASSLLKRTNLAGSISAMPLRLRHFDVVPDEESLCHVMSIATRSSQNDEYSP